MIKAEAIIKKKDNAQEDRIIVGAMYLVLSFAIFVFLFTAKSMFFPKAEIITGESVAINHFGLGGFTEYDLALTKELMDKDGDGVCDVCGMDIAICIESGQLQCNMGGNTDKLNLGVLDKTKEKHHYHADIKVFINGEEVDLAQEKYFVKSRFIHVENDVQGDTAKVLHMHATGIPLWLFFDSIDMKLPDSIKLYVNNQLNSQGLDYVYTDLDKILITDGRGDLQKQLDSVTDFAKNH